LTDSIRLGLIAVPIVIADRPEHGPAEYDQIPDFCILLIDLSRVFGLRLDQRLDCVFDFGEPFAGSHALSVHELYARDSPEEALDKDVEEDVIIMSCLSRKWRPNTLLIPCRRFVTFDARQARTAREAGPRLVQLRK
jgi:hypothetical protein